LPFIFKPRFVIFEVIAMDIIKQSKEYGDKIYLIYSLGVNDFMIYQKNLPIAELIVDKIQIENSTENYYREQSINNTHYSSVGEAEKALLEHVGVIQLDWL